SHHAHEQSVPPSVPQSLQQPNSQLSDLSRLGQSPDQSSIYVTHQQVMVTPAHGTHVSDATAGNYAQLIYQNQTPDQDKCYLFVCLLVHKFVLDQLKSFLRPSPHGGSAAGVASFVAHPAYALNKLSPPVPKPTPPLLLHREGH